MMGLSCGISIAGCRMGHEIVRRNIGDCVLVDVQKDLARAKALDLSQTAPIRGSSAFVADGGEFEALYGCELVVLATGVPRSPFSAACGDTSSSERRRES
jgi:malate/lactate dehydrogenase